MVTASLNRVATPLVGACNKNGFYYAWRVNDLAAGPVWRYRVAEGSNKGLISCLAAAIWDSSRLFVAGPLTTIDGMSVRGSIRQLKPATGQPVWQTALSGVVIGSPSMNGAGVIAVPTWDSPTLGQNGVYLSPCDRRRRPAVSCWGQEFAQPTFAGKYLFTATESNQLTAYVVP